MLLILAVTAGGWAKLQGMRPPQIAIVVIYLVLAVQIARWRSGLLPVAASFAVIVLIVCAISGPAWFARDRPGYSDPLLDASIVGALTIALVPLQILLVLAARAAWRNAGASRSSGARAGREGATPRRLTVQSRCAPGCWNWNTGSAQNRLPVRDCGFESHPGYRRFASR